MRFDTNDTGKYIFDQKQTLTSDEFNKIEEEYTARIRSNPVSSFKNVPLVNAADNANQAVTFIILGVFIIVPLLLWFVFFKDMPTNPKAFSTAGITLAATGLLLFVKLALRLTVRSRIYSETVDAECIGYARYFEADSGENAGPGGGMPYVSPVFTYRYDGNQYTSCYDGFDISGDSKVALGPARINISSKHPESVYNHGAQQKGILILFAVVLTIAGVGMTIVGLMF